MIQLLHLGTQSTVRLCVVLALGDLLLTPGVGGAQTVRLIAEADLKDVDPVFNLVSIVSNHGYMVYDTLFAMDSNLKPQPQMVGKYETSKDQKTWTFTLRPGLKFTDGTKVRAADAVASIKRWSKRLASGQLMAKYTESWTVMDDNTFVLKLTQPYGVVLETLANASNPLFVMKEEFAANTPETAQITTVIGSGPFIMKKDEWVPGHKVVYVKNPDYVPRSEPADGFAGGKVVRIQRAEWLYVPDAATAAAALRRGEADWLQQPSPDFYSVLQADPNITVTVQPTVYQGGMRLNWKYPPFNNVKARLAMMYLTHQEKYVKAIVGDKKYYEAFCGAYFGCGLPYGTNQYSEALREYNPQKAKQLFMEAGYKGEPIVIMDPTDRPDLHPPAIIVAQELRDIGINVDLQAMDWATLSSRRAVTKPPAEGGWHIFSTWIFTPLLMDPTTQSFITGACDKAFFGWDCDEELQRISSQWPLETDPAKKKALALAQQKRVYEVVPYVNFGQWRLATAYRKELKDVLVTSKLVMWNLRK